MTAVNTLCIRDPDGANEYVSDGEVNMVTIDIGGSWRDYSDFAARLSEGQEDALEYERSVLGEVRDLPPDNPVRMAVVAFFSDARADAPARTRVVRTDQGYRFEASQSEALDADRETLANDELELGGGED